MDEITWNSLVQKSQSPHFLQSWQWGQVKSRYGWTPDYWCSNGNDGLALILKREARILRFGPALRVLYTPRGPLLNWENYEQVVFNIGKLEKYSEEKSAIFLKIDPEVVLGWGIPGREGSKENQLGENIISLLKLRNWRSSLEQIQFRNTFLLDIDRDEESILCGMKQKTRYNIRLALKKNVGIRIANSKDFPLIYKMYAETAIRDGFIIRPQQYYETVWSQFSEAGLCRGLIAEVDHEAVAGIMIFIFGKKAWYLYGMSTENHRDKMPNYLLQWEAIRYARNQGCELYDLWGAPDTFEATDKLWGIYRFKDGLDAKITRYIGAWDFPVKPSLYSLYTIILPKVLNIMRRRGVKALRRELD